MSKTISEWLQHLPVDIREKAIANCKADFKDNEEFNGMMKLRDISVGEALASMFTWKNSPEGHDYWSEIAKNENYNQEPDYDTPNEEYHGPENYPAP